MKLSYKFFASPVGELKLVASEEGLVALLWENDDPTRVRLETLLRVDSHQILGLAAKQLGEYFRGERDEFSIPLDMRGTTFQRTVWCELLGIPFGETRTYSQIATTLGKPNASRAVGAANGRNPVSIIVPCHRVIGSSGKLTGFAGGLSTKARLLEHESRAKPLLGRK